MVYGGVQQFSGKNHIFIAVGATMAGGPVVVGGGFSF